MAKEQAAIKERAKTKAIDSKKGKPVEASQLTSEELAEKVKVRKARKLEKNKKRRERQKASADVEAGRKASP
jgi:hypothetical protein